MRIPVLAYHKIDFPTKDVRIKGAYTAPARFAKQMRYLKKRGCVFYTASELIEYYRENQRFPHRGAAVTFDDGWKDNYTFAFPILKQLGIKATIFLVPSVLGEVSAKVVADGESAREHLSRENVLEMARHNIEFGSHSLNHKLLHRIADDEINQEVVESKREIENLLQKPCKTFAYPAGFFTDYARREIENAGYSAAFSTVYGSDETPDLFALNRTEILRRDGLPFAFGRKVRFLLR